MDKNIIDIKYGNRPNLRLLFGTMLERKRSESRASIQRWHDNLPFLEDYDDSDDWNPNALTIEEYYGLMGCYSKGSKSKKGKKSKAHGKNKKSGGRLSSFVKGNDDYFDEEYDDSLDGGGVTIYFYSDITNKDERGKFDSISEFDKFCEEEGFQVPNLVAEDLCYNSVSHVCLNPFAKMCGKLEIMCSNSYAGLYYDVQCMEDLAYDGM